MNPAAPLLDGRCQAVADHTRTANGIITTLEITAEQWNHLRNSGSFGFVCDITAEQIDPSQDPLVLYMGRDKFGPRFAHSPHGQRVGHGEFKKSVGRGGCTRNSAMAIRIGIHGPVNRVDFIK